MKGPAFNTLAAVVGYSTTASDIKANWSVTNNSYLLAKGSNAISGYSLSTDLIGSTFLSPPSAGAFDYGLPTAIIPSSVNSETKSSVIARKNMLVSTIDGVVQVVSFTGIIVRNMVVTSGQVISLPSGAYIVRSVSSRGTTIQKVAL